jgi:hypothetical protein
MVNHLALPQLKDLVQAAVVHQVLAEQVEEMVGLVDLEELLLDTQEHQLADNIILL